MISIESKDFGHGAAHYRYICIRVLASIVLPHLSTAHLTVGLLFLLVFGIGFFLLGLMAFDAHTPQYTCSWSET